MITYAPGSGVSATVVRGCDLAGYRQAQTAVAAGAVTAGIQSAEAGAVAVQERLVGEVEADGEGAGLGGADDVAHKGTGVHSLTGMEPQAAMTRVSLSTGIPGKATS
ncbi:hypothetical protein [Sphaerisporangium perillae]|uniref:hypothetical protein n=1 Tax=Sphaerisporangium perillae TaxID=2935860 RepID=UPI00200EA1DC|nr:hypothetical protein [Sphaerisporangium perillae]